MLTDTHCHIFEEYYDVNDIMNKINSSKINRIINNACDFKTSLEVLDLSNKYSNMYCAIGLHPENNLDELDDVMDLIVKNKDNTKMIAIGEIGLDYYYNKYNKSEQMNVLEKQLKLAEKLNLPVIIHSREATGDMISILKKYNVKGVIHCFNGSVETAKEYIKLGFKLGINGVITFKNCKLIDVFKTIGIDNIVFETDSPYLTPVPYRGEVNDPTYIMDIVYFVSKNIGVSVEDLADISNKNIKDIFDI